LVFDDGTFPPSEIVEHWFDLLRRRWVKCFYWHIFLFFYVFTLQIGFKSCCSLKDLVLIHRHVWPFIVWPD
jgi:hypothetical protein